jgi:hypothetical protein
MSSQSRRPAIAARKRPFFFLSGYGSGGVPEQFKRKRVLHKPCELQVLKQTIEAILSKPDSPRHHASGSDGPEADIILACVRRSPVHSKVYWSTSKRPRIAGPLSCRG